MHPLETNASTSSLQWFMDSPMVRKSDEKSSMIKTPSRIEASLPSHLGGMNLGGSCFPGSHCRAFSKVTTQYPLDVDYDRRNSSSSPEHRQSPEKGNLEQEEPDGCEGDREVPTSPPSGDDGRIHHTQHNGESNLNGFINSFIVQTRPKDKRSSPPEPRSPISPSTFRRVKMENNNSNNNRLICEDGVKNDEKLPKSDRENCKKSLELPFVKDYLEYRRPDHGDEKDQQKILTGSDILRRMYASFGSRPSDGNGLLGPSHQCNEDPKLGGRYHEQGQKRMKSPIKTQNRKSSLDAHPNGVESHVKDYSRHRNTSKEQPSNDGTTNDSIRPRKPLKSGDSVPEKHAGAYERQSKTPDNANTARQDTTKRISPSHSIESLLSNRKMNPNVGKLETAREKNNFQHEGQSEQCQSPRKRKREKSGAREKHWPSHKDSDATDFSPDPKRGRVSERDVYNEKSREIFRQDKEVIQNSLRHNQTLPFTRHPQDSALHSPPWQNASAMAALQANLLSSFPQNGAPTLSDPSILLKSASLAAAVSANPLLIGPNPYLVNPYVLRGLGSSEVAAAAAYHQAMAHGLLQSHPSINPLLNSGVLGNPGIPQGLNPFMCGLGDTSTLAAAIAASVRPHAAGIYTNFPYSPITRSRNHMDEVPRPHIGLNRSVPSPDRSPLRPKRLSSEAVVIVQGSGKQRREDIEMPTDPTSHQSDETFKRGGNMKISEIPSKPFVHSSEPAILQKRKTSPPSSPTLLPPKRKPCTTDFNRKTTLKHPKHPFTPNPLLKSPKNKNGDAPKMIPVSSEKSPRNSEKLSTSRPSSYKNLTRERRLVANARERTRVHTISSAFEELRQQIPSYSCNQKLSKLAILRIACSYIQSLSVLSGRSTEGTFKESVDQCTRVLQAESRARSRRKNNKAQIEWEVANYEKGPNCDVEVSKKATDVSRNSRGTTPSTYHNITTANSPRHDEDSQVLGEDGYRKAACDSPGFHRDSLGDHKDNKTHQDLFNDSGDQSRQNVTEESTMTESDSLESGTEQIMASSDTHGPDSSTWEQREPSPHGDTTCHNNARLHYPSGNLESEEIASSINENEQDTSENLEDQQNDLINVED